MKTNLYALMILVLTVALSVQSVFYYKTQTNLNSTRQELLVSNYAVEILAGMVRQYLIPQSEETKPFEDNRELPV